MKVLWDYFCLITHVVPLPFPLITLLSFCCSFFGTTPTIQHFYSLSAFYNTTIPLAFLSYLCNYLRFSSPYIRITLTPYTPLPYLDFILHVCVFTPYSHHHFITATILLRFYESIYEFREIHYCFYLREI